MRKVIITVEGKTALSLDEIPHKDVLDVGDFLFGGKITSVEFPEPEYQPGTVVRDANGTFWKRASGPYWEAFGVGEEYSHSYPVRPLRVIQ